MTRSLLPSHTKNHPLLGGGKPKERRNVAIYASQGKRRKHEIRGLDAGREKRCNASLGADCDCVYMQNQNDEI
jgi:hypothetical protein